ncbi:hypothetical protein AB9F26_17175 [Falsihalocynthiibacter sp. BN13B15]|uniref:hypothetical protein n=1 Tax=Falsihalocynthiibacter sp. BN13B15 TaxID=3240871 RepID=UPI00351035F0
MTISEQKQKELIAEILKRALGNLSDWHPAELMPGVGPQYPQVHFDFEKRLKSYCVKVSSMLENKPIDELRAVYLKNGESILNPLTSPQSLHFELYYNLEQLKKCRPPWFGSGWSERNHLFDIEYWMAAHVVTINEAALLLVGVDPRKTDYDALFGAYGIDNRIDEILQFLEDRFELLVRNFGDPEDGPISIKLADLCAWVRDKNLSVSDQLSEVIKRRLTGIPNEKSKQVKNTDDKPLHGNTRALFQKVLLVVAIDHYGLKTPKDAAKAAKAIVEAGDFVGFSIDAQNLTKLIRAGFSQLDDDVKAEMLRIYDQN